MKDTIILVVTGSVAGYKAAELARNLAGKGLRVKVAMTSAAEKFVTPLTFEALTGGPVLRAGFPQPGEEPMAHINFSRGARLALIAPATADILGKLAHGVADDSVLSMLLACGLPVMAAPAMNTQMYRHPAVQANIALLAERGVEFVGPTSGALACGEEGEGKMEDVETITAAVMKRLGGERDLAGMRVLVTAGGCREPIDPVRYMGNRSSGKMGAAVARMAARRGAQVTLVAAHMETHLPEGVALVRAYTGMEMRDAVGDAFPRCDILVMAAAVTDYRVEHPAGEKVKKKDSMSLDLIRNPDILASVALEKGNRVVAGFAAETEDHLAAGRKKLVAKNLDMIVINDVSRGDIGFGSDFNEATLLTRDGRKMEIARAAKDSVANAVLDEAAAIWRANQGRKKPEAAEAS